MNGVKLAIGIRVRIRTGVCPAVVLGRRWTTAPTFLCFFPLRTIRCSFELHSLPLHRQRGRKVSFTCITSRSHQWFVSREFRRAGSHPNKHSNPCFFEGSPRDCINDSQITWERVLGVTHRAGRSLSPASAPCVTLVVVKGCSCVRLCASCAVVVCFYVYRLIAKPVRLGEARMTSNDTITSEAGSCDWRNCGCRQLARCCKLHRLLQIAQRWEIAGWSLVTGWRKWHSSRGDRRRKKGWRTLHCAVSVC
jgi:hypothetical protein